MKRIPLVLLLMAALGVAFTAGNFRHSDWDGQGRKAPPGLAQKVAGPWIIVGDFGNCPFESVMLLTVDGGLVCNNTLFINPDGSTSHLTTAVGGWKPIGHGKIAVTFLIRIVESTGALKFYEKAVAEMTLDANTMSGDAVGLVYLPTQDPLDPTETPVQILSGPVVCRSIQVETLNP